MQILRTYAGATPIEGDGHVDVPLSNIAVSAFDTGEDGFVGDMLFPAVPVGKQSDKYYVIDKSAFLRVPESLRAPGTKSKGVEFRVSSDSYYADNHALHSMLALEHLENADMAIQLRENSTRVVVTGLRRAQEVRIANKCTSISNVGSGVALTGANKWGDANSDPIADVSTGHAFIRRQSGGLMANTMVIDTDTLRIVRRHPRLLDLYKYTSAGLLRMEQVADAFDVARVLVANGSKENALEEATSSVTNIWSNVALLAVVGANTGLQTQTLGLRYQWRNPIFPANFAVKRATYSQAGQENVEIVEAGHFQDEKIVAGDLAYLIADTL